MKILLIQQELKAPKNQKNSFGNYNYRSCEDILEAVKPLCIKHNCILTIRDEIVEVGGRVYVEATATLKDLDNSTTEFSTAYAREPESKKGMDESQITGAASSYARKYALNGLFCIDDTKDVDAQKPPEKDKGDFKAVIKSLNECKALEQVDRLAVQVSKSEWTIEDLAKIKTEFSAKRGSLETA
jgi:hypothetical protein